MAVLIACREVRSAFDEDCKRRRSCVPLGGEVGRGSASRPTCVDIRTVCDQPRNGRVSRLMSEGLQRRPTPTDAAVDRTVRAYR